MGRQSWHDRSCHFLSWEVKVSTLLFVFKEVRELRLWHFNNRRLGFKLNFKKKWSHLIIKSLFPQKQYGNIRWKHNSFFPTCLAFCKYVWEKPNLCVKYHTCSFWKMFDFYPTCLEKTKHVGIFTPGCYFPHMFGFWHIGMGKGTHVCKKPHNYMFANVWHFPHMCGKSHWHAYFPLSYRWSGGYQHL